MVDRALRHETQTVKQIAVDYTLEACSHCTQSNTISLTYRGGSRWRSPTRFLYSTFSSLIQCPKFDTSGLNFNLYLSSLEGDKSHDVIDFEFLGKDKTIVQTNYYTSGPGNRERINDLGFDCSDRFHAYAVKCPGIIEWMIDGNVVRREERKDGEGFPEKPMFSMLQFGMQCLMHLMFASIRTFVFLLGPQWRSVRVILDRGSSFGHHTKQEIKEVNE